MRTRISDRFTELHTQRQQAEAKLTALQAAAPTAMDPSLFDEVPYAGGILPDLPPALKTRLCSPPSTSPSRGTSPATRPPSGRFSPTPPY